MKHRCITPSTLLGLVGTVLAAGAATVPLAPPPPSAFADTESAVTYPLAGWNDLTRFYSLSMEVETNAVSCVQVAFGTDRNSDGDLAPEETAFVAGYDCGAWFAREEGDLGLGSRSRSRVEDEGLGLGSRSRVEFEPSSSGEAGRLPYAKIDLAPVFDPAWDAVKVTTRGTADAPAIAVEFKNNPMRIVVR